MENDRAASFWSKGLGGVITYPWLGLGLALLIPVFTVDLIFEIGVGLAHLQVFGLLLANLGVGGLVGVGGRFPTRVNGKWLRTYRREALAAARLNLPVAMQVADEYEEPKVLAPTRVHSSKQDPRPANNGARVIRGVALPGLGVAASRDSQEAFYP